VKIAYDATHELVGNIPVTARIVAGYVAPSGFAWTAADWARFPTATHVRITPSAEVTGAGVEVLDVEKLDATPAQAPIWAHLQRAAGRIPTVYCNLATWSSVIEEFDQALEAQPAYWIAHYDEDPDTMPVSDGITAVAKQYRNTPEFDMTAVPGAWPGVIGATVSDPLTPTEQNELAGDANQATGEFFVTDPTHPNGIPAATIQALVASASAPGNEVETTKAILVLLQELSSRLAALEVPGQGPFGVTLTGTLSPTPSASTP
jgi:hypothetical protein